MTVYPEKLVSIMQRCVTPDCPGRTEILRKVGDPVPDQRKCIACLEAEKEKN